MLDIQTIEKMKRILDSTYLNLQNLNIVASIGNINVVASCLNNIRNVYNILKDVDIEGGEDDGK